MQRFRGQRCGTTTIVVVTRQRVNVVSVQLPKVPYSSYMLMELCKYFAEFRVPLRPPKLQELVYCNIVTNKTVCALFGPNCNARYVEYEKKKPVISKTQTGIDVRTFAITDLTTWNFACTCPCVASLCLPFSTVITLDVSQRKPQSCLTLRKVPIHTVKHIIDIT